MSAINYDNEIGTLNKPPQLMDPMDYPNWKQRMEAFINLVDYSLWSCYLSPEPIPMTELVDLVRKVPKSQDQWTETERNVMKNYKKAYAYLTMALPTEILQNFKTFTTADTLWVALFTRYEGTSEMRELRKDELIKQFQSFTYIEGESFSSQANKYIRLVSDLKSMNRYFEAGEVNKRFLDSLPSKWRVYCILVKRFEQLGSLTIEGLVAILETYNAEMIRDE